MNIMSDCNIIWHTFSTHIGNMLQQMFKTKEYSDVTLICEDSRKLNAHKVVLSASSPILKAKIDSLADEKQNLEIFLDGIHHSEMELILEFMYLGKVPIIKERSNRFLDAVKRLQLKDMKQSENILNDDDKVSETDNLNKKNPTKKSFQCSQCDVQCSKSGNLKLHVESQHEGIIYRCNLCNHSSTQKKRLKLHVKC